MKSSWASGLLFAAVVIHGLLFAGSGYLPLFDWDELNFAEVAREMHETGNLLQPTVNYLPFHEKPPLFSWFQTLSYSIFGVGPAGARFPNLVCGVATFLLLFRLGKTQFGDRAIWWPLLLSLSVLPGLYFQSGIIDPWFNLFIFAALWPSLTGRLGWREVIPSGLLLGAAVLTKGPAAGLIAGLCWAALLIFDARGRTGRAARYLTVGLLALLPIGVWVALLWRVDGGYFAREFLDYQWRLFFREDAGHGGFPGYHVVVLLFGCFPLSWLAAGPLFDRRRFAEDTDRGLRILFWVVLVLFSVVNTKIVHYSSLCYLPLAWFAARRLTTEQNRVKPFVRAGLAATWGLYALAAVGTAVAGATLARWTGVVTDPELASRLALPVHWPWYTFLPGLIAVAGVAWSVRRGPDRARWVAGHLILSGLFLLVALYTVAPRIQRYTQGAPTEFFANLAGENVYVGTAYYKSYAHWYHAAIPPERYDRGCRERQCRFHEPIDRPLYFASPLRHTERVLREVPDATLLAQRGGFSFYRRPATEAARGR